MRNCANVFRGKTEALFLLGGTTIYKHKQWRTEGGGWGFQPPLLEIPKALQNRAKLNPNVKTVKDC